MPACGWPAPAEAMEKTVHEFCKNLGVAFQILNDFKDWEGDSDNKLVAGQDALAARPTLLLALALEGAGPAGKAELLDLLGGTPQEQTLDKARLLFEQAGAFAKAQKLVDKFRAKAEALADGMEPAPLRELMYFLVDFGAGEEGGRRRAAHPPAASPGAGPMSAPELSDLLALFPDDAMPASVPLAGPDVPEPYRGLLVHEHHMTVTVEEYHGGPVDVAVLARRSDGDKYSRKILLVHRVHGQGGAVRHRAHRPVAGGAGGGVAHPRRGHALGPGADRA